MPATPPWVRRNRMVAWTSYFCVLIGFGTLAMGLTAAGSGHRGWALVATAICTTAFLSGMSLFGATAYHDRITHHAGPNLLWDPSWPAGTLEQSGAPHRARHRLRLRRGH
ncbi:hypothetical protein [Nocardia africana]|uniref:Uncharacterized protein n=1 Tax=Nocardia africana TaxID=134964 RepID=A0A378WW21_9NOCA|nr:hypothetical protein [Nocardia africana]MCC3313563.1 hypothetical protein [Nocardia africana]SUA45062.1 Uncharacterised protein [Nocardia africana]